MPVINRVRIAWRSRVQTDRRQWIPASAVFFFNIIAGAAITALISRCYIKLLSDDCVRQAFVWRCFARLIRWRDAGSTQERTVRAMLSLCLPRSFNMGRRLSMTFGLTILTWVGVFGGMIMEAPLASAAPSFGSVKFDETMFDFGEVVRGAQLAHRFRFVNIGDGVLSIQGVHAACGCTAIEVERGKSYQPGESGFVDVKLDTSDFAGSMLKTVTVMSNEKVMPDRTLTLKAFVKSELDVMPPLADFGEAYPKTGQALVIAIKPLNGFALELSDLKFDKDLVEATLAKNGNAYVLNVRLNEGATSGFLRSTITMKTNSTYLKDLQVPVRGTIKGDIETAPAYVEFGAINPKELARRTITLKGQKGFDVAGMRTELNINGKKVDESDRLLTIKPDGQGTAEKRLAIELTNPSKVPGAVHGKLFIKTNDPAQPEVAVDLYAFFR